MIGGNTIMNTRQETIKTVKAIINNRGKCYDRANCEYCPISSIESDSSFCSEKIRFYYKTEYKNVSKYLADKVKFCKNWLDKNNIEIVLDF